MVGLPGDAPLRTDESGYPVNRMFADVTQDEPEVRGSSPASRTRCSPSTSSPTSRARDVTWNPSVCSVLKDSLFCPPSEEFILPVEHGNDRVEWFIQLSDEIVWNVKDKESGDPRAVVTMRAGGRRLHAADIRHQGFSPKRSMLLVWGERLAGDPRDDRQGRGADRPRCASRRPAARLHTRTVTSASREPPAHGRDRPARRRGVVAHP